MLGNKEYQDRILKMPYIKSKQKVKDTTLFNRMEVSKKNVVEWVCRRKKLKYFLAKKER